MATPQDKRRAAHLAASRIEEMIYAMLEANETGEVAATVNGLDVQPLKRVVTKEKVIRVAQGNGVIERVR